MIETQHRPGDPLDGPVVLLDDVVVQVFVLAYQDVDAGVGFDNTFNGCCIGAALVTEVRHLFPETRHFPTPSANKFKHLRWFSG